MSNTGIEHLLQVYKSVIVFETCIHVEKCKNCKLMINGTCKLREFDSRREKEKIVESAIKSF